MTEIVSPPNRLFDETFLRKLERLAILSRRAMSGAQQGERRSTKRGQSVEFADFRPYAPGDDLRRIDWNAYARMDRFFIKLFVEEEDLTIHLLLDTSESMAWGEPAKLPYATQVTGALAYIGLTGLDRVTVTALGTTNSATAPNGGTFTPSRGRQQAPKLFAFLQALTSSGQVDLAATLRSYAANARRSGPLLLISDLMDESWQPGLSALASRGFEITILHTLAPQEIDPTVQGDLKLIDSETQAAIDITADYDLLQRYRDNLLSWQSEIASYCSARGIYYIPVNTETPFEELIFAVLRQRGVVL